RDWSSDVCSSDLICIPSSTFASARCDNASCSPTAIPTSSSTSSTVLACVLTSCSFPLSTTTTSAFVDSNRTIPENKIRAKTPTVEMTRYDFKAGNCFENNRMHIASLILFDYINTLMQSQSYYDYIYFTIPLQFRKTIFFLCVDMTLSLGTIASQERRTFVQ